MKEKLNNENKDNLEQQKGPDTEVNSNVETTPQVSKGEERYNKISSSISEARSKVSSWFKKSSQGFGNLFKRAAIGALNSPETTVAGARYVGSKAVEGANYVGSKITEGANLVGETAHSAYEFTADKVHKAENFVNTKKEQITDYAKDKINLAEAVGSLLKDKTTEKLTVVGDKISDNFEKVKKFGEGALDSATLKIWYAKDSFNSKKNELKRKILERKAEIESEKLRKTLAKLEQYKRVGNLEAVNAA